MDSEHRHEGEEASVPQPGAGGERGIGELLLAAVAGSALAPFVQAVATKLGDDVYGKIKNLLTRRTRTPADHIPGSPITLADTERAMVVQLPPTLSPTEASGLATLRMPARPSAGWVFVHYDPHASEWQAKVIPQPVEGAIEVCPPSRGE